MRGFILYSALVAVLSAISCALVEACTSGSSLGVMVRPPSAIVQPLCFLGRRRLRLRGGSEGREEGEEAGTASCPGEPTPTKSRAKALRKAAEKDLKKRPEPDGIKAVEEGAAAYERGDWASACQRFALASSLSRSYVPAPKVANQAPPKERAAAAQPAATQGCPPDPPTPRLILSRPSDNLQAKPHREGTPNYAANSPETLAAFIDKFGRGYRTRFPPEPNGYLHLGHAKAMAFNFGQAEAARREGIPAETILRFDDTNPEAEKHEFFDAVVKDVSWLGHEPVNITHTSDYFDDIYQDALRLVKDGWAYVCHQTAEEMRAGRALVAQARREASQPPEHAISPWRNRSVEENLHHFDRMQRGEYLEGQASLRMKGNLTSDNPAMWDPVFYRVKHTPPHARTGLNWCIYPSYDLSHCIVDSIEGITHSCCTLEFASRQAADGPYYWILDKLDRYKPVTFEFARCNVQQNVLSKRRLMDLVTKSLVQGWDDPRLLTLRGLRRRGYDRHMMAAFASKIGVSTSLCASIQPQLLESCARERLDWIAPRMFAVLRPLQVSIENPELLPQNGSVWIQYHPKDSSRGGRNVAIGETIYIDQGDFIDTGKLGGGDSAADKAVDEAMWGLREGQPVSLLGSGFVLTLTGVQRRDADGGHVEMLKGRVDTRAEMKKQGKLPKGTIHWICGGADGGVAAQVNLYGPLMLEGEEGLDVDEEEKDGFEDGEPSPPSSATAAPRFNPDSLTVVENSLVEPGALSLAPGESVQFLRVGYFCRDSGPMDRVCSASTDQKAPVFNSIVPLSTSSAPTSAPR